MCILFFFFTVYFEACVHVAEVKLLGFIFSQTDRSRNSKEDVIVVFPPKDGRDILGLTERRRSTVRAGGKMLRNRRGLFEMINASRGIIYLL